MLITLQFWKTSVDVLFDIHHMEADLWHCNLWEWAVDTIRNPLLADKFVWDACRLKKFDGEKFVRFIHEPWMTDRFWDVQVCSVIALWHKVILIICYNSLRYQIQMANHLGLFCLRTKPNFPHLALNKDTPSSPI